MGFFSLVILVFMAISVLESGSFFNDNITHHAVFGMLGYALALGFDLVSVACMQARLNAARLHDERGAMLNLVGVSICAAVSAFANACGSLQGYLPADLDHTPAWMQALAPWLGMIFPAMIIVLSMTADHLLDRSAPSRGIDLDTYRQQEKKRVDMLQVRLDTEKELVTLEANLSQVRRHRDHTNESVQREWFFLRWLRPETPPPLDVVKAEMKQVEAHVTVLVGQLQQQMHDLSRVHAEALDSLSTQFRQQMAGLSMDQAKSASTLNTHLDTLDTSVSPRLSSLDSHLDTLSREVNDHLTILDTQMHLLTGRIEEQQATLDTLRSLVSGQFKALRGPMATRPAANGASRREQRERDPGEIESVALGQRILAAFTQQGITIPHRQIAKHLGCSPTTVGEWKARLQREGLLPLDPVAPASPTD